MEDEEEEEEEEEEEKEEEKEEEEGMVEVVTRLMWPYNLHMITNLQIKTFSEHNTTFHKK